MPTNSQSQCAMAIMITNDKIMCTTVTTVGQGGDKIVTEWTDMWKMQSVHSLINQCQQSDVCACISSKITLLLLQTAH